MTTDEPIRWADENPGISLEDIRSSLEAYAVFRGPKAIEAERAFTKAREIREEEERQKPKTDNRKFYRRGA